MINQFSKEIISASSVDVKVRYPDDYLANENEYMDNVFKKNQEFVDSLQYAQLIQQAILPKKRHFARAFDDSFWLYKPKDIIGGDFYWIANENDVSHIALADCTGHGIPGAMLAVLGHSLLNYIVLGKNIIKPSEILQELDKKMLESFALSDHIYFRNDWMDIGLCMYDKKRKLLEFTGAKHSLILIRNGHLEEFEGNKYPIAGWQLEPIRKYSSHKICIQPNDTIYLFSDGYADQFGGAQGKKFMKKRLLEMINSIAHLELQKQMSILDEEFEDWRACPRYNGLGYEQTDDVCIIGIKFN